MAKSQHRCDDPIRCAACLARAGNKATARRAAARRGAASRRLARAARQREERQ